MYRAVRKTILCLRKLNIRNNYLCLFVVGDEDRHSAKHSSNHHIGGSGAPAKPLPLPHHIRMNRRYVPYRMKICTESNLTHWLRLVNFCRIDY